MAREFTDSVSVRSVPGKILLCHLHSDVSASPSFTESAGTHYWLVSGK